LDYASYLKDFVIDEEKVLAIYGFESFTNLHQSIVYPYWPHSESSLLGILNGPGDKWEQSRQLFWQFYRAQNLASAQAVLTGLEGKDTEERASLAGLCQVKARASIRDRNLTLAQKQIEKALILAPDDLTSWRIKSEILEAEGNLQDALAAASRAVDLSPRSS